MWIDTDEGKMCEPLFSFLEVMGWVAIASFVLVNVTALGAYFWTGSAR